MFIKEKDLNGDVVCINVDNISHWAEYEESTRIYFNCAVDSVGFMHLDIKGKNLEKSIRTVSNGLTNEAKGG